MFAEKVTSEQLKKILNVQKQVKLLGFDEDADLGKFKYSYTTLAKIRTELGKIFDKEGIGVTQPITVLDGRQAIRTILFDEKGVILDSACYLEIMNPGDPQSFGKSVTYQRRYNLVSLLFIVADKDDDVSIPDEDVSQTIKEALSVKALLTLYGRLDDSQKEKYKEAFAKKKAELLKPKTDLPEESPEKAEQPAQTTQPKENKTAKPINDNMRQILEQAKIKG